MSYFDYDKTKFCPECKVLVAAHCPVCHSQLIRPSLLQWLRLIGPESAKKTLKKLKEDKIENGAYRRHKCNAQKGRSA